MYVRQKRLKWPPTSCFFTFCFFAFFLEELATAVHPLSSSCLLSAPSISLLLPWTGAGDNSLPAWSALAAEGERVRLRPAAIMATSRSTASVDATVLILTACWSVQTLQAVASLSSSGVIDLSVYQKARLLSSTWLLRNFVQSSKSSPQSASSIAFVRRSLLP